MKDEEDDNDDDDRTKERLLQAGRICNAATYLRNHWNEFEWQSSIKNKRVHKYQQ